MNKKFLALLMFSVLATGCFKKTNTIVLEEQIVNQDTELTEVNTKIEEEHKPYVLVVGHNDKEFTVSKISKSNPDELNALLKMNNLSSYNEEHSTTILRPKAIKDVAQLIAIQTAMKWKYEQLMIETERYAYLMDRAFNFLPLLMVSDQEVMVMPPVLAKSDEAMRIENDGLVTTAKTTYEILENAKYLSTIPNWRSFLMFDAFPKPEQPNPALLPRTDNEMAIWQNTIIEAWEEGVLQASELYIVNLNKLVRTYKGISLYHLLVAKSYLSKVNMATSPAMTNIDGNKMFLEQKVFRITKPAKFQKPN